MSKIAMVKSINPADLPHKQVYKLMTGSIVPRPIAWVSSMSEDGTYNLAPFSYFTAVSPEPPTIIFCPGVRGTDEREKDTYHNVRATGEFVVNFVNEAVAGAMNITATELPATVDEFQRAGLTPVASEVIRVPRVKESPIQWECTLQQIVTIGRGHIVIGTVVRMHFDDSIYRDGNYIDIAAYQPVGRLAGSGYSRTNDFFQMERLPSELPTDTES